METIDTSNISPLTLFLNFEWISEWEKNLLKETYSLARRIWKWILEMFSLLHIILFFAEKNTVSPIKNAHIFTLRTFGNSFLIYF